MPEIEHTLQEIADRVRRIETRLTSYLEAQGHPVNIKRPKWVSTGRVKVASMETSLKDVLDIIPPDWDCSVAIIHHDVEIARLEKFED